MPPLLQLQKLPGKGDGAWRKGSLCLFWLTRRSWVYGKKSFWADQKITNSWEKIVLGASYSPSNKLLLVARHIVTKGVQKCLWSWQCKNRLPLWRKYAPEVTITPELPNKAMKAKQVKVNSCHSFMNISSVIRSLTYHLFLLLFVVFFVFKK